MFPQLVGSVISGFVLVLCLSQPSGMRYCSSYQLITGKKLYRWLFLGTSFPVTCTNSVGTDTLSKNKKFQLTGNQFSVVRAVSRNIYYYHEFKKWAILVQTFQSQRFKILWKKKKKLKAQGNLLPVAHPPPFFSFAMNKDLSSNFYLCD